MVWLNLTAGVCRDMYQPIRGLIKAQWPIRSLIRWQQGPQLIINYRDVRHSDSFTCPLQHAIVQLSHYTISRPLNSYTGKLVVHSQTFYDLRTNIPVLSWSFDIRVLNGLQIALSNSGYKLLSDSLSSPLLSRGWDRGNFPLDGEERYNLDSSILSPQVGVCLFSFSAGCFSRDEKWQKCHGDKKRKCAVTGWCVVSPQTLT